MDEKIVVVGAGLAGLSAVDTLLEGGISPQDILIIHEGTNPWDRDMYYGFGGSVWETELVLVKDVNQLTELYDYLPLEALKVKVSQMEDFITKYTNGRGTYSEAEIKLDSETSTYVLKKIWASFQNKYTTIQGNATCRPITQISDYIVYDEVETHTKQVQQYTKLVLAAGSNGYNIAHSLGEYVANLAQLPLRITTPSTIKVDANLSLAGVENTYIVGSILGYTQPETSIIQGIIAGESILKSL